MLFFPLNSQKNSYLGIPTYLWFLRYDSDRFCCVHHCTFCIWLFSHYLPINLTIFYNCLAIGYLGYQVRKMECLNLINQMNLPHSRTPVSSQDFVVVFSELIQVKELLWIVDTCISNFSCLVKEKLLSNIIFINDPDQISDIFFVIDPLIITL